MGVQCEVYIADRNRAMKYNCPGECKCKDWRRCKCWDFIPSWRIYDSDFAELLFILRGKGDRDSVIEEFKMVKKFSDEGPWIRKIPDDFPKLLAVATTKDLKTIAKAWVGLMNEVNPVPERKETIPDYLALLQPLCKKSVEKKQSMYLWTCL